IDAPVCQGGDAGLPVETGSRSRSYNHPCHGGRSRRDLRSSRALIIACRPWEWEDQFPPASGVSRALK
ncbi:MAG: hypothetical protein ACE5FB_02960, partial [Candidatus Binatia bacterium]